jgi:hypothetical protein
MTAPASRALSASVSDLKRFPGLTQFRRTVLCAVRKPLDSTVIENCAKGPTACDNPMSDRSQVIDSKRRDVRVVEGARLEIALTICDGVLQISITVAKPTT